MKRRALWIAAALLLWGLPAFGSAPGAIDPAPLKGVPVLEQGRIKPFESYANNLLLQLSGRRRYDRRSALDWLSRVLLDPVSARDDKIFLINHPDLPRALGIEPEKKRRYSFAQLLPGHAKLQELSEAADSLESKDRTAFDNEAIRIHQNVSLYLELSHSFDFAVPHPDFAVENPQLRRMLSLPEETSRYSFVDQALHAHGLHSVVETIQQKDPKSWTGLENESFRLMAALYQWSHRYRNFSALRVIPPPAGNETWLNPWDALAQDFSGKPVREEIAALARLRAAFQQKDNDAFRRAAEEFSRSTRARGASFRGVRFTPLELLYNRIQPLFWAELLYGVTLLLLFWPGAAMKTAGAAWWLHTFGLFARITIMGRPPVGTLYETFLFVGWIAAGLGLLLERTQKNKLGLVIAGSLGFLMLAISSAFGSDGDTMKMLVAVLNSNFWLSTHVLAITTGYAGCCVAGVLGHVYLIQRILKARPSALEKTHQMMLFTLGFGLLFSALGTALGGIWADQSWGRFWGWDPKENGALMIVLWCAAIFHARLAGIIRQAGTAAACVFGMVVVVWAWFGVNLLSVGLHSYGFTSGIAGNLLIYLLAEALFLAVALRLAAKKLKGSRRRAPAR